MIDAITNRQIDAKLLTCVLDVVIHEVENAKGLYKNYGKLPKSVTAIGTLTQKMSKVFHGIEIEQTCNCESRTAKEVFKKLP